MQGRQILHYTIREKLGQGGMGEVYLAHDSKLDREVAIKFLPPNLQQIPEARTRLLREAQAASRLVHPNIVAIYAVENADGMDFIVMEYVRGRPLSDIVASSTLELNNTLDLARQIADALSVAHDTGVIHRDIKSSNILMTDRGQAKMLDFGLATFYGATQVTDAGTTMGTAAYMSPEQTEGRPIDHRSDLFSFGVVLYEMITGRRPFDGDNRNAIAYAIINQVPEPMARFKVGVSQSLEGIVAKALRKDPTERYQSAADMMADIKVSTKETDRTGFQPGGTPPTPSQPYYGGHTHTPYPPGGTPPAPQTPMHAQPTPQSQPQYAGMTPSSPSASYTGHAAGQTPSQPVPPFVTQPPKERSNTIVIVGMIVGGLIAVTAILAPQLGKRGSGDEPASSVNVTQETHAPVIEQSTDDRIKIAVLPFQNQGSEDDEYFADGVTEEITARLASVRDLGVIARASVEDYKGSKKPARDIGRELGVDYILGGTVRWQRGEGEVSRVRVTPQLLRISDGTSVWGDVYDEPMTAVFKVQSSIAKAVVRQLDVAINEPEQQVLEAAPTQNMEAYDAYLKGMRLKDNWNSAQDMRVAANQFEKAISLDPDFLMAYVRLSEVNADIVWFVHDQSESRIEASLRAAKRALEIAPESPEAQWAMGWFYYHGRLDLENALRYLEPVLEQQPNSADAHAAVAWVQRRQGRFDEAVANLIRSTELSPKTHNLWYSVGETYIVIRQYAKARPYLDRTIELRPEFPYSRTEKITSYILEGDLLNARKEAQTLVDVFGVRDFGLAQARVEYLLRDFDRYFEIAKASGPWNTNSFYKPVSLNNGLAYFVLDDIEKARTSFAAARDVILTEMEKAPDDFRYHGALGIAYAGLGMKDDALRHTNRANQLLPPAKDALRASYRRWETAAAMILLGDHESAIDQLEVMMSTPSYMTGPLLRKDPLFDSLRDNPRFKALLGNT